MLRSNRLRAAKSATGGALFLWLAGASLASAQIHGIGYDGASGPATFYTINPATGAATAVGPVGFNRCSGMDVGPGHVVFATCETAAGLPVLVTINPATGAGSQIGPTGLQGAVSDISFRGDGVLFAYEAVNNPGHTLATINTTTGAATVVGETGLSIAPGNGMSFDLAGTLFLASTASAPMPELYTLSQVTGLATFVTELPIPGGCTSIIGCRFNAMDVDPVSGQMYAVLNDSPQGAGNRRLATINTATGAVTIIGPTAADLDAIAFPVFVPVELLGFSIE